MEQHMLVNHSETKPGFPAEIGAMREIFCLPATFTILKLYRAKTMLVIGFKIKAVVQR
jgi:hypothetical protein